MHFETLNTGMIYLKDKRWKDGFIQYWWFKSV
jgi:hypothetical protein